MDNSAEPQFLTKLENFFFYISDYLYRKRQSLLIFTLITIVIIAAAFGGYQYKNYLDQIRQENLYKIEYLFNKKEISFIEKNKQCQLLINKFLKKYPNSKETYLVYFYQASLLAETSPQIAIQSYEKILATDQNHPLLNSLATISLVNLFMNTGQFDLALKKLKSTNVKLFGDLIMLQLIGVYIALKNVEKAQETLKIFFKDYPNSLHKSRAIQLMSNL